VEIVSAFLFSKKRSPGSGNESREGETKSAEDADPSSVKCSCGGHPNDFVVLVTQEQGGALEEGVHGG